MNRLISGFLGSVVLLSACREERTASVRPAKSSSSEQELTLEMPFSSRDGEVDWNREFRFLKSRDLLAAVADACEVDELELEQAIRFEADLMEGQVRVISRDENQERAAFFASEYRKAWLSARQMWEGVFAEKEAEALKTQKVRDDWNRDHITYQKALEALRDDPDEELEVPEDGVIYRKEE